MVFRTPHTEVGEVMQVLAEYHPTVAFICACIQNVGVPEFIHRSRWTNLTVGVNGIQR